MRSPHGARWARGKLVGALCCLTLFATPLVDTSLGAISLGATPQRDVAAEYDLKGAYLYNFLKFVEWPSSAMQRLDGQLRLCVFGSSPIADVLVGVEQQWIGSRELVIEVIRGADQVDSCHAIFLPDSLPSPSSEVLEKAKGHGILTVTEFDNRDDPAGVINLWKSGGRIVFSIDLEAARRKDLRISSRLLEIAVERDWDGPVSR